MYTVYVRSTRERAFSKDYRRLQNAVGASAAAKRKGVDTVIRPTNRGACA
jgi:hypothetical protein